jgi:hypothetical protein
VRSILTVLKAVALPNQTIRTEEHVAEHGAPTTQRRLTYDDLIVHLRHYSPGTRRGMWQFYFRSKRVDLQGEDALQGLRELLSNHSELVVPNLGSLLGAVAKLIADDVSSQTPAVFAGHSSVDLGPFSAESLDHILGMGSRSNPSSTSLAHTLLVQLPHFPYRAP